MEVIKFRCKMCNIILTNENWYPSVKGHSKTCKNCWNKSNNERNKKRYEKDLTYQLHKKENDKKRREESRMKSLNHYSNGTMKCECCNENHIEFLSIDHINGNGNKHRKEIGRSSIYEWLVKNNYPKGYKVLCMNCNTSIGFRGYCPHQKEE